MSEMKRVRDDRPRSNRDQAELGRKESLLGEPHVVALTAFVEELRGERGGDDTVPWFDPTEAGVETRILALLETPGRRAALGSQGGSRFISADNDDPTAEGMWKLLQEAGIDRSREYTAWNVVPWYVERGKVTKRDVLEARPALEHVMGLFRELRVILLLGKTAQDAWSAAGIRSNAVVLTAPHPSPLSIRTSAERRRKLLDALVQAKRLAQDAPARPTIRERETPSSSSQGGVSRVVTVEPAAAVVGAASVPGNKGSSQRAVLLGAIADGESRIRGFGRAADTLSALDAARTLGAEVVDNGDDDIRVRGAGLRGLRSATIDCGNAGTVLRLLCGLLVGQRGETFELVGDESLTMRPHERAAAPLRQMGAAIETTDGHAPVRIEGRELQPISYELPVASAQVKSAVLLAGLFAESGPTTVIEPHPTRDHTERMLAAAGVRLQRTERSASVWPVESLPALDVDIPGDISAAAPLIVAAVLLNGSELILQNVNVNPLRIGLLAVLERMGARAAIFNRRTVSGEPVADLEVRSTQLVATTVEAQEVPRLVDELPLVALLGAFAHGTTTVRGAEELRAKETDRIETVVDNLRAIGVRIEAKPDGFVVRGTPARPRGGRIDARGDHRIAMLGAIAGLVSREGVEIEDADCVAVSFPGFFDLLAQLAQRTGEFG